MSLQVTGKNLDVGEAFQTYVRDKLDAAIGKYVGQHLAAHVRVEKERNRFHTNCSVRLRSGLLLEAEGNGADAYASADGAFEHLEKRLRRYKRRLKRHHHGAAPEADFNETHVNDLVVSLEHEEHEDGAAADGQVVGDNPLVVAETGRALRDFAVSDAVMQLDLTDEAFLVFRNAANGAINVVYRRKDGNIGWIDPTTPAKAGAAGHTSATSPRV